MPQQIGFQIIVIFEPHSGDGLTVQNGGVCLLVDFVLLPVTNKEVSGDHQGKSRIRVLYFQFRDAFGGSLAKDIHTGDAVIDSFLLALKVLPGVAGSWAEGDHSGELVVSPVRTGWRRCGGLCMSVLRYGLPGSCTADAGYGRRSHPGTGGAFSKQTAGDSG